MIYSASKTFARSLTTDSTKKLQAILSQLQSVMDALELQSRFDEVRRQRLEYQKAQDERDAAALERAQQSQFRDRQHAENYRKEPLDLQSIGLTVLQSSCRTRFETSSVHNHSQTPTTAAMKVISWIDT